MRGYDKGHTYNVLECDILNILKINSVQRFFDNLTRNATVQAILNNKINSYIMY